MSHSGGQSSNPTSSGPVQTQDLEEEEDDISITSTVPDDDREYEVEEVVYQLTNELGAILYLVKWAGYDEVENTWEPETSFIDPSTLEEWRKKHDAISRGLEPEFDIDAWNKKKTEYDTANEVANAKRRAQRKAKRRRLEIAVSPSIDSEYSDTMDLTDAVRSPRTRGRRASLSTDYEGSRERVRGSRDSSLSNTDSLMEDLWKNSRQTGTDRQNLERALRMSKDSTKPSHDQQKKQAAPKKLSVGRLKKPDPKKPGPKVAKKPAQTPRKAVDPKAAVVTRQKEPVEKPPARGPAKEVLEAAGIRSTFAPIGKTTGAVTTKSRNGSGKLAKRTGHPTEQTTAPGRDVLENWTSKPKQKKPIKPKVGPTQSPERKLYKTLATKRKAELRGRKEATPDVNSLDLRLPRDYNRPLPKPLAPATNLSLMELHSDGLDSLFEGEGLGDEGSTIQIDEEPLQPTPRSGIQDKSRSVVSDDNVDMQETDAGIETQIDEDPLQSTPRSGIQDESRPVVSDNNVDMQETDEGIATQIDEEPLQSTPRSGIQDKSRPVVSDDNVDMQETDEGSAMQIDEEPQQSTPRSGIQDKSRPVVSDNNVDMQETDASNDSRQPCVDRSLHRGSPVLTPSGPNEQSITGQNESPVQSTDSLNSPTADPSSLGRMGGYPKSRPKFYADPLSPVPQAKASFDISRRLSYTKHFFGPDDLLVTLRIFNQVVGDVLLRGLDKRDSWQSVYRMKKSHEIDISLEGVITIEEYKNLVRGRSNPMFSNGWVEGFEDTHAACDQLATFLRERSLAAVWNHPHEDLALLIYHQESSDWGFLDTATKELFKTPLRVASRLRLPPLTSSMPSLHLPISIPGLYTPSSIPPPPPPILPEETIARGGVASDSSEKEITTQDPRLNNLRSRTDVMAALNSDELDTVFRNQLGIDFSRLRKLHGDILVAEKFLLVFPTGTESEGRQFERFLRSHDVKRVFLDGDRLTKWKEFCTGSEPSCLVLHASFPFIDRLPGLSGLLIKNIILWRVSVNSPIPHDENERHLIRIFPQGGAICITEDLMLNDTRKALEIIRWFCRKYYPQRLPNTWKLVFRPAIREWLFDMAGQKKDTRFLEMHKEISDLIPPYSVSHLNAWIGPEEVEHLDGEIDDDGQVHPFVSVRNIPKYGSRREDDHRKVPKGMTQEERNKDHLMEWFAGWAISHMEEFRKFTIISRLPHLERWKKWHHVKIQTPDEFTDSWKNMGMTLGPDDPGSKT